MLCMTRKPNDAIHVGDDIVFTIVSIGASSVKIGITAPRQLGIHRDVVYREIQAQKLPCGKCKGTGRRCGGKCRACGGRGKVSPAAEG